MTSKTPDVIYLLPNNGKEMPEITWSYKISGDDIIIVGINVSK